MKKMKNALFLCFVVGLVASQAVGQETAFRKTKQVIQEGDKTKQRDVALIFQDDKILVSDRKGKQTYTEIANSSVTDLTYELSKHPRYKTALFVNPLFLFSPGKKHWLTIEYQTEGKSDFVLFQLDKKEYQRIVATAESKTGKDVKRVIED